MSPDDGRSGMSLMQHYTDALAEASEEVLKELEDAHHQDIVSSRTTKALEAALAAYRGEK